MISRQAAVTAAHAVTPRASPSRARSTASSANQTAGVVPSADSPANSAIPVIEPAMSMA